MLQNAQSLRMDLQTLSDAQYLQGGKPDLIWTKKGGLTNWCNISSYPRNWSHLPPASGWKEIHAWSFRPISSVTIPTS